MHAATSKVENSAQGLSCELKFVHEMRFSIEIRWIVLSEAQTVTTDQNCPKPDRPGERHGRRGGQEDSNNSVVQECIL